MKNNKIEEPSKLQDDVKKQYEAPRVIYRAPLEATAGLCGDHPTAKTSSTPGCSTQYS